VEHRKAPSLSYQAKSRQVMVTIRHSTVACFAVVHMELEGADAKIDDIWNARDQVELGANATVDTEVNLGNFRRAFYESQAYMGKCLASIAPNEDYEGRYPSKCGHPGATCDIISHPRVDIAHIPAMKVHIHKPWKHNPIRYIDDLSRLWVVSLP
jgi:hypothetical protein